MAFADEPPPVDAAELVARNPADAVITLGDLQPAWIASLQSFAGFEGCVRYGDGPHQYTQEEAAELARDLPAAGVLLCHCPPWG